MSDGFLPGGRVRVAGAAAGPLAGLGFAVKDLIDVAGVPTNGGNPDWARYAGTPDRHAWVVQTLLDAGASVVDSAAVESLVVELVAPDSLGLVVEHPATRAVLAAPATRRKPRRSIIGTT